MSRPGQGALPESRPILISGVYRSGTTILAQIINAHPGLELTYDSVKFLRFCLGRYDPIDAPGQLERLVRETHHRVLLRWHISFDLEACLAELTGKPPSYALAYDTIMRHLLLHRPNSPNRWGEKIAVMWSRIPDFLEMFPNGRVIHIFRDPRDATASYKKLTYEPGFTYLDCALNCLHAMRAIRDYQTRFGPERVTWVRMESLLEKPREESARLCDFLGLPFLPEMLDPSRFTDKTGGAWKNNSIFEPDMQGISNSYRRWENALTPAELTFIELLTQGEMIAYGYEPSGRIPNRSQWAEMYNFIEDPFLGPRFAKWLASGEGSEGYRTDPVEVEMKALKEIEETAKGMRSS